VNLLLVMLLGGLWHGAAWTYVCWGGLHGAALAFERLLGLNRVRGGARSPVARVFWFGFVQSVVLLSWIVFRAPDLSFVAASLGEIAAGSFSALPSRAWVPLAAAFPMVAMHLRGFVAERVPAARIRPMEKAILTGLMAVATLTLYGQDDAFIYFQF
jgi:alginate O-acetyltransferase complex protein AlgI